MYLLAHPTLPYYFSSTTTVKWLVRLRIGVARPCARGTKRFHVVPPSTYVYLTYNASGFTFCVSAALAIAARKVLSRMRAAFFGVKRRMESAASTCLPRIRSATRRAFCGEIRTLRVTALASITILLRLHCFLDFALAIPRVTVERPRGRKLSKLVSNHILCHIHGDELASVMDRKGVTDHFRNDRRTPRPCLDDLLFSGLN